MSLTAYLKKRLIDLLEEKRVVVWYDGDAAFQEVARAFKAPNSSVILAQESRLRARRQADDVVGRLNDFAGEERQPPDLLSLAARLHR